MRRCVIYQRQITVNSERNNYSLSIKYGIRTLLATCAVVLAMNFACARGSGVILLNWFGFVATEDKQTLIQTKKA